LLFDTGGARIDQAPQLAPAASVPGKPGAVSPGDLLTRRGNWAGWPRVRTQAATKSGDAP